MNVDMKYVYGALALALLLAGLMLYKTSDPVATRELPTLPTGEFGDVSLMIELATSSLARQQGLSGREVVPEGYGMLFVFEQDGTYGFWMKDTLVPLDIFWLDSKGQVIHIEHDVATSTYPHVFYPPTPARYVLETRAGFARAHGIELDASLRLQNIGLVSE